MNVPLIEMPQAASSEALDMYRDFCADHPADAEAHEILVGLEELADGTPLLQLSAVFADVPVDAKGRPRLAIARADRLRARVNGWGSRPSGFFSFECDYEYRRGRKVKNAELHVPSPLASHAVPAGYAIVPIVPPSLRRGRELMAKLHILWEVERWADHPREVGPDVDPYLLRRISADLWAVLGEWELTPIEQAVLAGRRTTR